jgi:hypothetical protein
MIFLEPLIQLRFICEDAASSRPIRRRGHWLYQHTQIGISGPEKDMLRIPINPRILRFSPKSLYWLIFEESVNMNQNEEVPDSLGGLGDLLPADVLKMVNFFNEPDEQSGTCSDSAMARKSRMKFNVI